jgi:hypothetical protein
MAIGMREEFLEFRKWIAVLVFMHIPLVAHEMVHKRASSNLGPAETS